MSKNKRKDYTPAQNIALTCQVSGVCPLCTEPLFHTKKGKSYKAYEIAHIYPLNPSPEEIELLKDEEKLSDDVNDEKNVIPLCESCHGKLDKFRTAEEYRLLVQLKKGLLERSYQELLWKQFGIESELISIIESLYELDITEIDNSVDISYDPKTINDKTNQSISRPTVRKIRNNVTDYYSFIKSQIAILDKSNAEFSNLVSLQIKTFYTKQKQQQISQQAVFDNIVKWIQMKTKPQSKDGAEIITSFFIQNCEVFE